MARNANLIHAILRQVDSAPSGEVLKEESLSSLGATSAELFEHVRLLKEDGLIDAVVKPWSTGQPGGMFLIHGLRSKGHDLLHGAR